MTTGDHMLQQDASLPETTAPPGGDQPGEGPPDGPRRKGNRRAFVVAGVILCLALAGIFTANAINLGDYVLSPGLAQAVGPLITVPSHPGSPANGQILLTDVYENQVSALQWPFYKLNPNDAIYSATALFGPSAPAASQVQTDEAAQMASSSVMARVVALRRLGYQVTERMGAVVEEVVAGTPAARLGDLVPGDAITAIDGKPTPSAAAVTSLLMTEHPGQRVTLSVTHADGDSGPESLVLASRTGHSTEAFAGIGALTTSYFVLPFAVNINADGIGGPSAGLAFTLGIINQLSGGDLTGGRKVAATGTIDLTGAVGPVGGVAQKTIAVKAAGATVFLVPASDGNYRQALTKAGPHLHVIAVSTLSQALNALQSMGGHVPATTGASVPGAPVHGASVPGPS